jgi:hypothetical protein
MPFTTSIQSFTGPHTSGGVTQCAVDWAREKIYIGAGSFYISRLDFTTGVEEAYAATGTGDYPPTGLDADGNLYAARPASLYAGGIAKVNGTTFADIATDSYPTNKIGGGDFANVSADDGEFVIDVGNGGGSLSANSNTIVSADGVYLANTAWTSGSSALPCPGLPGDNIGYYIEIPSASQTQILKLRSVACALSVVFSTVGTISPTDVDATWSLISLNGVCLDQTDGNLLAIVSTMESVTHKCYVIKIDVSNADVLWTCALPDFGSSAAPGGDQFSRSRIQNQQLGILTGPNGAVPRTVTFINTSDGSLIGTPLTDGLAGLTPHGAQCYDDTKGCIVTRIGYSEVSGSPSRLNATPSSFTGWAALYVAPAVVPAPSDTEGWFHVSKPLVAA